MPRTPPATEFLTATLAHAYSRLGLPGGSVLLAVSGGADSTALLVATALVAGRLRLRVEVASLDHGLRPESATAVESVSRLAARFALPPPEVERDRMEEGAWLAVRIGEGRKREVRRLFAALDARVERLVRTRIGPLRITGLRSGQWRLLRPAEVAALAGEKHR